MDEQSLIRTEIEFGLTFAGIAESAYSEGQLRRGDSAKGVAQNAYQQAIKLMDSLAPQVEELLLRLQDLEAALRKLEGDSQAPGSKTA